MEININTKTKEIQVLGEINIEEFVKFFEEEFTDEAKKLYKLIPTRSQDKEWMKYPLQPMYPSYPTLPMYPGTTPYPFDQMWYGNGPVYVSSITGDAPATSEQKDEEV